MAASLPRMLAAVPKVAHGFYGDPDTLIARARHDPTRPFDHAVIVRIEHSNVVRALLCASAVQQSGKTARAFVSKFFWQEILR